LSLACAGVAAVRFFNNNAGPFSQRDLFINSLSIVPEPNMLAFIGRCGRRGDGRGIRDEGLPPGVVFPCSRIGLRLRWPGLSDVTDRSRGFSGRKTQTR
jgi:hypothetical protein